MHSDVINANKVFAVEPGKWPLISRRTFPFAPVVKKNQACRVVFEDYGFNHALPYIFLSFLSLGTVFLIKVLPDSNWGDPGFPVAARNILFAIGALLGLYSAFATLVSHSILIDKKKNLLAYNVHFFGIKIWRTKKTTEHLYISVNPVQLALTRTGLVQTGAFGIFLCQDEYSPIRVIGCLRTEGEALKFANEVSEQISLDVINSPSLIYARLSR